MTVTTQTPATPTEPQTSTTSSDSPITPKVESPSEPANVAPADPAAAPVEPAAPAAEPKVETKVEEPAAPVAEEYELELADTSPLTDDDLKEIAEEASRLGLSKVDAEKLIAAREGAFKRGESKIVSEREAKAQASLKEIQSHPDFVGDAKVETFAAINLAVSTFGSQELVDLLKTPEYGNNLVIARFLKELGHALQPEGFKGKGVTPAGDTEASTLANLYPAFFEAEKK